MAAIRRYRTQREYERAIELSTLACAAGDADACYLVAADLRALGRVDEAREWFVSTCNEWGGQACEELRREEIELALDRHPGYLRCLGVAAQVYRSSVWITFTLVNDESDGMARLVVDPMPGQAILRSCLVDALASDRFAPIERPVRVTRNVDLHAHEIAAKLAALGPAEAPAVGEDSCPGDRPERCETVGIDVVWANAVYTPDASREELASVRSFDMPANLDVTLHFCVEPDTGRISRIRRSRPGPGQAVVDRLIFALSRWRVKPIVVDGERVLACSQIDFSVVGPQPELPAEAFGAALPPLEVVPAVAIYTPVPSWRDFRAMGRRNRSWWHEPGDRRSRSWRGFNTTTFCVDESGRVADVRTKRRFPYPPEFDALVRAWIASWRYKPLLVGGRPHRFCTEQTFMLEVRWRRTVL